MVWLAFAGTGVHAVMADTAELAHERALTLVAEQLARRGYHPPTDEEVRVRPSTREELESLGLRP